VCVIKGFLKVDGLLTASSYETVVACASKLVLRPVRNLHLMVDLKNLSVAVLKPIGAILKFVRLTNH
jgi:hypothetical protein